MRRVLLVVAVVLVTALMPASAQAYANAFFPTQSSGNRGADVLAIQYLLQHDGQSVAADGVFGATTVTAVKAFQTAKGLGVDGIVGPQTWGALVPTIRSGDSNAAVKALQVELNAKRRLSLPVDGVFSTAVRDAVVVLPVARGHRRGRHRRPDHLAQPGLALRLPRLQPRTSATRTRTATVPRPTGPPRPPWPNWKQQPAPSRPPSQGKVPYGDAGFEHGGDIPGHGSHENGMDIDIWPIRTDNAQCTAGRITWQSSTYDRAATRQLVQAIRAAAPGHVKFIWFNDPTLISEGLTQTGRPTTTTCTSGTARRSTPTAPTSADKLVRVTTHST